jgi:hypothetical protein
MAYFELPYAIDPKNPFLIDRRSGPWLSTADALANIPIEVRMQGLLVTVLDTNFMYVFEGGVADINLVPLQAVTHWGDISGTITNQTDLTPYIIEQSRAAITLTTLGSGGVSTYNPVTGELNVPHYLSSVSGTIAKTSQFFTSGAGQTVFTIAGGYIAGSVDIYLNGSRLNGTEVTATDTATVVLTVGAELDDVLEVVIYGTGSFLELLYAVTPLHYDNISGIFSIQAASATQPGYLSAADWSAFHAKLNSFTLTTTGTSGAATWDGTTLNIPQYSGGGGGVDVTAVHLAGTETITGDKTFTGVVHVTGYSLIARKTLAVPGFGAGINTTTENGANTATPYLQMTLENPSGNKRNVTFMGATLPTGYPDEAYAIYLPNASGTMALLSDITGAYLPLTGGIVNGNVTISNALSSGYLRLNNGTWPSTYFQAGWGSSIWGSNVRYDGTNNIYDVGTNYAFQIGFSPIGGIMQISTAPQGAAGGVATMTPRFTMTVAGDIILTNTITASAFIMTGATASQLLAGNGTTISAGTGITISAGVISATGGGGSSITFVDDEVPTGTVDNVNLAFSLAHAPSPVASLKLYLNGQKLFTGDDFTLAGTTITMVAAVGTGNKLRADYRY